MDKKATSKAMLTLISCLLAVSSITPNAFGKEMSIEPTADSYTSSIAPNDNYGGSEYLNCYYFTEDIYGTPYNQVENTHLKFDLSEIPREAAVNSIILRMHTWLINPRATNRVGVFLCSSSAWQELTIKWSNCPTATGLAIDTAYVTAGDKDYDFDVTTAVKGKTAVALVLKTVDPTGLGESTTFYSREVSDANHRPKLIVEYTTTSQPVFVDPFSLTPFIMGLVVIVIIILVAYALTKKKKPTSVPSQEIQREPITTSEEKKFCRYCGAKNKTDAVLCEKCRKKIG